MLIKGWSSFARISLTVGIIRIDGRCRFDGALGIEIKSNLPTTQKNLYPKSFHFIKTYVVSLFPLPDREKNNKFRKEIERVAERILSHLIIKICLAAFHKRRPYTEAICRPNHSETSQPLALFASAAPASSSAALLRSSSRHPDPLPTTGVWKFNGLGSMLLSFDRPKPQSE